MTNMSWGIREAHREPVTFHDAPTVERDGRRYLTDEAARELGDRVAARYSTLLDRLAQE
jgi:hypothetical protein